MLEQIIEKTKKSIIKTIGCTVLGLFLATNFQGCLSNRTVKPQEFNQTTIILQKNNTINTEQLDQILKKEDILQSGNMIIMYNLAERNKLTNEMFNFLFKTDLIGWSQSEALEGLSKGGVADFKLYKEISKINLDYDHMAAIKELGKGGIEDLDLYDKILQNHLTDNKTRILVGLGRGSVKNRSIYDIVLQGKFTDNQAWVLGGLGEGGIEDLDLYDMLSQRNYTTKQARVLEGLGKGGVKNKILYDMLSQINFTANQSYILQGLGEGGIEDLDLYDVVFQRDFTDNQTWILSCLGKGSIKDKSLYYMLSQREFTNNQTLALGGLGEGGIVNKYLYDLISKRNLTKKQALAIQGLGKGAIKDWSLYEKVLKRNIPYDKAWVIQGFGIGGVKDKELYGMVLQGDFTDSQAGVLQALGIRGIMDRNLYEKVLQKDINCNQFIVIRCLADNGVIDWTWYDKVLQKNISNVQARAFEDLVEHILKVRPFSNEIFEELLKEHNPFKQKLLSESIKKKYFSKEFFNIVKKIETPTKVHYRNDEDEPDILETSVFSLEKVMFEVEKSILPERVKTGTVKRILDEYIRYVNSLHNESLEKRAEPFTELTPRTLYTLISRGGELYTSSLRKVIFPQFKEKIENRPLREVILELDPKKKRYLFFVNALANFDLINEILPPADQTKEINLFYRDIVDTFENIENHLKAGLTFYPFIHNIGKNKDTIYKNLLFNMLVKDYKDKKLDSLQKEIFLMIFHEDKEYMKKYFPEENKLFKKMEKIEKKYKLEKYPYLDWFDTEYFKENNQIYTKQYFYPDKDGIASFNTFVSTTKEYKKYIIDENGNEKLYKGKASYDQIKNKGGKLVLKKEINGVILAHELELYDEKKHEESIKEALESEKYVMPNHRGHSYHLISTFYIYEKYNLPFKKLIGLGSCGGYDWIFQLARMFEGNADFFATQGEGKMNINNPLIKEISETIVEYKGKITWDELKQKHLQPIYDKHLAGESYIDPSDICHKLLQLTID